MEKAAAYAISAFIVGFGLWILIAGLTLQLPFRFEVGSLSDRLMSSTPE